MSVSVREYAEEKRERFYKRHPSAAIYDVPLARFMPPEMHQGDLASAYWPRRPMTAEDLGINEMENVA